MEKLEREKMQFLKGLGWNTAVGCTDEGIEEEFVYVRTPSDKRDFFVVVKECDATHAFLKVYDAVNSGADGLPFWGERYLSFGVKIDGCCRIVYSENYFHYCGPREIKTHGEIIELLYKVSADLLNKPNLGEED